MKHDADCLCRECRRRDAAPPSSRITIPLADIAAVIADSVRDVLEARHMTIVKNEPFRSWVSALEPHELEAVLREVGNNTAACLQGLDESPIEEDEPLPSPRRVRGRR